MAIYWKRDAKGPNVAPKNGVAFDKEYKKANAHATNGMKITRLGEAVICHIDGKHHYANKCPDIEDSVPEKNPRKLSTSPRIKPPPKNHRSMLQSGKIEGMTLITSF